jgi:hypothetical protein
MNANSIEIQITDLADTITNQLGLYARDKQILIDDMITDVAKTSVKMLKEKSPKKTGKYAKSWKIKKLGKKTVIYNEIGFLTHLLEHGHVIKSTGGRTRVFIHIKPVEDYVIKQVTKETERILKE